MEYVGPVLNVLWAVVVIVSTIVFWPTTLGFPIGTIFQLVYLGIAYWLYRKYAPDGLQAWVREKLRPFIGWIVDEARDFIASSIQTKRPRETANGEQVPHRRGCSLKRLSYVFIAGGLFVLGWQYILWPYYIWPRLPF